MRMTRTRIVFVGGFLGAGKTTLLWAAASRLRDRGLRVGLITNDQAPDLVDTSLLAAEGFAVREVAGSCFCCNFPGLLAAAEGLRGDLRADVLIGEPVGSCTDLSATLVQPLKEHYANDFVVAPLSVAVDPARLSELEGGNSRFRPGTAYIFRMQLEEADAIVVSKIDRWPAEERAALLARMEERHPGKTVRAVSALTGEGLDAWLDFVLNEDRSGSTIAEVDYDLYAEGEAALGWLNGVVRLRRTAPGGGPERSGPAWGDFARALLGDLAARFRERRWPVGHVKLLLEAGGGHLTANLAGSDALVSVRGEVSGDAADARLTVNARVQCAPEELEALVREAVDRCAAGGLAADWETCRALAPGRPRPTHRYGRVVE
jgi:Ni2+-binding GTPase involved in maturation of urease and hydrogenase